MEHCARCRAIGSGLRATREVGALPLVEPPEGLALRILQAEEEATQLLPIGKRLGRGLSLLAGYAMRPQVSMAALLMLMIGSSLFFLRAQPGDRQHVLVTERGVPESDNESVAVLPKKAEAPEPPRVAPHAAPSPRGDDGAARRDRAAEAKPEPVPLATAQQQYAAAPPAEAARGAAALGTSADDKDLEGSSGPSTDSDASYDAAMAAYRDGRYSDAQRRFDEIASLGGPHAANAALYGAQALRRVSGCPTAAPRFEEVHSRYPRLGRQRCRLASRRLLPLTRGPGTRTTELRAALSRSQLQDSRQRSDRRARPTRGRSRARRAQSDRRNGRSRQRQSPCRERAGEACAGRQVMRCVALPT